MKRKAFTSSPSQANMRTGVNGNSVSSPRHQTMSIDKFFRVKRKYLPIEPYWQRMMPAKYFVKHENETFKHIPP
jgi:hypothetical protein